MPNRTRQIDQDLRIYLDPKVIGDKMIHASILRTFVELIF
jgi:hypothetical protein